MPSTAARYILRSWHDIFGHWTLSKGKIGDKPEFANETVEEGTIREIKEEMNLDITLKKGRRK